MLFTNFKGRLIANAICYDLGSVVVKIAWIDSTITDTFGTALLGRTLIFG